MPVRTFYYSIVVFIYVHIHLIGHPPHLLNQSMRRIGRGAFSAMSGSTMRPGFGQPTHVPRRGANLVNPVHLRARTNASPGPQPRRSRTEPAPLAVSRTNQDGSLTPRDHTRPQPICLDNIVPDSCNEQTLYTQLDRIIIEVGKRKVHGNYGSKSLTSRDARKDNCFTS